MFALLLLSAKFFYITFVVMVKRRVTRLEIVGSFSIDDGDGNCNVTNKQFNWSSEENKRAVRWHALMNESVSSSTKQQREITMFTALRTTWAYNCTALILCI